MAFRVEIASRAERDLASLFCFIDADRAGTARDWFQGLERAVLSLEDMPDRGSRIAGTRGYRQLLYGTSLNVYRILYEVNLRRRVVFILHIRHGARKGSGL